MSKKSNEGKDLFGGKYWEDENGRKIYERTGPFGKKYWEDEDGNQTHERTGPFGNKYYEDSDGNQTHERTGPFGNKYYEDSDGKQTHKRTGPFGGSFLEKDAGAAFVPASEKVEHTTETNHEMRAEPRSSAGSGIIRWLSKQGIGTLFVIAVLAIAFFIVIGIPILGGLLLIKLVNRTLISKTTNKQLWRWTSFPVLFILGFLLTSELVGMTMWGFSCMSPHSSSCAAYVRQPHTTVLGWHENIVRSTAGNSSRNIGGLPSSVESDERASLNWSSEPESASSIDQQQAVQLVQSWLDSKPRIFAPPFDEDLLRRYIVTTSETFRSNSLNGGSMGWLKENRFYYTYDFSEVQEVLEFNVYRPASRNTELAYIVVNVSESLTQYDSRGRVVPENSGQSKRVFKYELAQENGQWKIYDYSRHE